MLGQECQGVGHITANVNSKHEVVPVFKHHAMKECGWGSAVIAPHILNLMDVSEPASLSGRFAHGKEPPFLIWQDIVLPEDAVWSGRFREERNLLPLLGL